jgi:hypothetical protein
MSRATVVVASQADRNLISTWARQVPINTRVEFKAPKRTVPQNDRMWAMLTIISRKVEWRDLLGRPLKMKPEQWKLFFLDMLSREPTMVPNADGTGFVNVGSSSSDLSRGEHSDLTTLIEKFAADRDVDLGEPVKDVA